MTRTRRKKKQKLVEGAIARIEYEAGKYTCAQLLVTPWIRVFDAAGEEIADLATLVSRPVLFRVAVENAAITDGRWPILGQVQLRPEDRTPDRFMQDLFDPSNLRILSSSPDGTWRERPATPAECEGLEAASVWAAEHVERRISDHYAGRTNLDLLSQRLIRPGDVFTIILDRGPNERGNWVVSGQVHDNLGVGDRVSVGQLAEALTIAAIRTYMGDRELATVRAGQSAMLHLTGDVTTHIGSERVLRTAEKR
jgi:hypothetical protein